MNLGMDEGTNSDTETEKESEPAKKRIKLNPEGPEPGQLAAQWWQYITAAQQHVLSVKYIPTNASTSWAVFFNNNAIGYYLFNFGD